MCMEENLRERLQIFVKPGLSQPTSRQEPSNYQEEITDFISLDFLNDESD